MIPVSLSLTSSEITDVVNALDAVTDADLMVTFRQPSGAFILTGHEALRVRSACDVARSNAAGVVTGTQPSTREHCKARGIESRLIRVIGKIDDAVALASEVSATVDLRTRALRS